MSNPSERPEPPRAEMKSPVAQRPPRRRSRVARVGSRLAKRGRQWRSRWPELRWGRVFRRMGLPAWTFLGIAIAGWLVDRVAEVAQLAIAYLLFWTGKVPTGPTWDKVLETGVMLVVPLVVVAGVVLWLGWESRQMQARSESSSGEPNKSISGKRNKSISGLEQIEGKKGLILLVSNPNSANFAIDYHFQGQRTLEQVWLLPSNERLKDQFGSNSKESAQKIQEHCEQLAQAVGRPLRVEIIEGGVSPGDAQDTYEWINRIFRQTDYAPEDLAVDCTGGTKPMTVGAVMACLRADRELEYVAWNSLESNAARLNASEENPADPYAGSSGPYVLDYQYSAFDLVA